MKNRGKCQNPRILIKFSITARKRVTSRRSVSSSKIGRRNSRTNKERNLGNLVRPSCVVELNQIDEELPVASNANLRAGENWILDSGCMFHLTPNRD